MQTSIVGFFDILGTKNAVMDDRFSDVDTLEFVNAIGFAAEQFPNVRFAVFSDSLVISASQDDLKSVLRAINLLYGNWIYELIYVRGAISHGDIHWVDDSASDKSFRRLNNFTYARVYGKGLVSAHNLEQKAGPGAICFLTEGAADIFRKENPCTVLDSHVPLLCWSTKEEAEAYQDLNNSRIQKVEKDTDEWRQISATKHYWDMVFMFQKFLPEDFLTI